MDNVTNANNGGGAGGSGYTASGLTNTEMKSGVRRGNGLVKSLQPERLTGHASLMMATRNRHQKTTDMCIQKHAWTRHRKVLRLQ